MEGVKRGAWCVVREMNILELMGQLPWRTWESKEWWAHPDNYPRYVEMGARLKPRSILELGAFEGYGLIGFWMGAGAGVQRLDWVDNESYTPDTNSHCVQNLVYVAAVLNRALPELKYAQAKERFTYPWELSPVQYDLIHVDGDHTYEGALADMLWAWERKPAALLVDDYDFGTEVRYAVDEFIRMIKRPFEHVPTLRGWALFQA